MPGSPRTGSRKKGGSGSRPEVGRSRGMRWTPRGVVLPLTGAGASGTERLRDSSKVAQRAAGVCVCVEGCGSDSALGSQAPLCMSDAALCPQARCFWVGAPGERTAPPACLETWLFSAAAAAGSPGQPGVGVPGRGARGSARGTVARAINARPHPPRTRRAGAFLALPPNGGPPASLMNERSKAQRQ